MSNRVPEEHILDVAKGDLGLSRAVRQSLMAIRSSISDQRTRNEIDDVLAGRQGMREFGRSESFANLLDQGVMSRIDRLTTDVSEEDRERLATQGEALLDRLRRERPEDSPEATEVEQRPPESGSPSPAANAVADRPAEPSTAGVYPGTRKPNRERVIVPDEPDDDDRYFGERRKRGWLE